MEVAILSILTESNKEPAAEREETNTTRRCVRLEAYAGDAVDCCLSIGNQFLLIRPDLNVSYLAFCKPQLQESADCVHDSPRPPIQPCLAGFRLYPSVWVTSMSYPNKKF